MAKTSQNDNFYANNVRSLQFTIMDTDVTPNVPVDLTGCKVQWALSRFAPDGSYSTTPVLKKDSDLLGGVTIDNDPTTGKVVVSIEPADTANLSGKFYHELEVVDTDDEPVVVSTGTIVINKNVKNV